MVCALLRTTYVSAADTRGRTSSLSWVRLEGSEGCIATNTLAQAVEERLKRKVFVSASQADVSVEGHIEQTKNGPTPEWRAVLTIRDAHGGLIGTREINRAASTCTALDDAIVFVVSVLIDPDAALRETKSAPTPPAPPVAQQPPTQTQTRQTRQTQHVVRREEVLVPATPSKPWRFEATAGGGLSLGLLPNVEPGVTAAIFLEPPGFWGIELSGTYWALGSVAADRNASSDVSLAYGGVALCPFHLESGRYSYRGCLGVEVGSLQSQGKGFDQPMSDESLALHVFVPNRFDVVIAGPLVASFGLSLIVPLVRNELSYTSSSGTNIAIFRPSPIAGATDLSLGLRFP